MGHFMSAARAKAAARLRKANRRNARAGKRSRPKRGNRFLGAALKKASKASTRKLSRKPQASKKSKASRRSRSRVSGSKRYGRSVAQKVERRRKKKPAKSSRRGKARKPAKKKAASKRSSTRSKSVAKKKAATGGKKRKTTAKQRAAARKNIKKAQAARRRGRKGKRRTKRGKARVSIRRKGRSVTARARSTRKGGRVRARRWKRGGTTMVAFKSNGKKRRRGRRKGGSKKNRRRKSNSFRRNMWASKLPLPAFLKPHAAVIEEAASYLPGAVAGVAGAALIPSFIPAKIRQAGNGWAGVGLTVLAAAVSAGVASAIGGKKQGLGAAIGGLIVSVQKVVAKLTDPDSKVRGAVGIGLSDLANYAGLGDDDMDDLVESVDDYADVGPGEVVAEDGIAGMLGMGEGDLELSDFAEIADLVEAV